MSTSGARQPPLCEPHAVLLCFSSSCSNKPHVHCLAIKCCPCPRTKGCTRLVQTKAVPTCTSGESKVMAASPPALAWMTLCGTLRVCVCVCVYTHRGVVACCFGTAHAPRGRPVEALLHDEVNGRELPPLQRRTCVCTSEHCEVSHIHANIQVWAPSWLASHSLRMYAVPTVQRAICCALRS